MSETSQEKDSQQHGPPMPRALFKLVNPLLKLALNSPLHSRMSDRLMVLSFTGRKSGKRYATPVGYVRQGPYIFVFTHSTWRHNFKQPAPVQMRIKGKTVDGMGQLVSDAQRIRQMIQALTTAYGPEMAQRMGFWVENLDTAAAADVQQATRGTYFIEIKVQDGQ